MKTFSETQGVKTFDWNAFLARKKKDISEEEWEKAHDLASSWVTCACGNQCSIIPREDVNNFTFTRALGSPLDNVLRGYGSQFFTDIQVRDMAKARKTLKKIEKRSAFLIAQIEKEAKETLKQLGYTTFL